MKASELKKLIREEVRKTLNESDYKFNDANTEKANDFRKRMASDIKTALKPALIKIAKANPDIRGEANIGLAIGLIAFDLIQELSNQ